MWAIQPIPAPGGVPSRVSSALAAVSCPAARDCFAVGSLPAPGGTTVLVDELKGMRWDRQSAPSPGGTAGGGYSAFTGISCPSSVACAAVGTFTNGSAGRAGFAETWNGRRWSVQSTPAPAASPGSVQLSGVSCASAILCVAVGSVTADTTTTPIAELYDGHSWTPQSLTLPTGALGGELSGISCTAAGACQAVGGYQGADAAEDPLVEAFDGSTWREAALPIPTGAVAFEQYGALDGIACADATACVAVGSYSTATQTEVPYSEVMSGTEWTVAPVPFDTAATAASTGLSAVACTSASACTAAGLDGRQLLVEDWDGTGWAAQPTAVAPRGTYVDDAGGVACVSSDCVAVGSDAAGNPYVHTDYALAQTTSGGAWSLHSPRLSAVASSSELDAISCASTAACMAVGDAKPGGGPGMRPLAERWDGRRWRIQTVRVRGALTGVELGAVSCPTSEWCMAAGSLNFASNTAVQSALALRWNGTGWWRAGTPAGTIIDAVSCVAPNLCLAVGPDGIAETWNGRRWSLLSLPDVPGLTTSFSDVSCYDATRCMIVGEAAPSCSEGGGGCPARDVVVDERLSGGRWILQKPPQSWGALALVACPAAQRCVATSVVAEVYDGRRWTVQRLPGRYGFVLNGLSCAAVDACTAVGSRTDDTAPVAEAWNGLRWTEQRLPAPPSTGPGATSTLNGVSCPTTGVCLAVGSRAGANGLTAPFAERYS